MGLLSLLGWKSAVRKSARKPQRRGLQVEPLEIRAMLSVSPSLSPSGGRPLAAMSLVPSDPLPQQVSSVSEAVAGSSNDSPINALQLVTEVEPNNTFGNAQVVTLTTGDILTTPAADWTTVNGTFSSGSDVDTYTFTISARSGFFVEIDSDSASLNTSLTLFNESQAQIDSNDNGFDLDGFQAPLNGHDPSTSLDPSIYRDLDPGTYFVRVNLQANSAPYRLRMLADTNFASTPPVLNSLPGSGDALYLDYDGHAATDDWGTYVALPFDFSGNAAEFSPGERLSIFNQWRVVAEDYSPFNVNITTVNPGSFGDGQAMRMVMTNSTSALLGEPPNVAGIAFLDSYGGFSTNTAFTFMLTHHGFSGAAGGLAGWLTCTAMTIGNTATHEFGHTLNLEHYSADGLSPGDVKPTAIMATQTGVKRAIWAQGTVESLVAQDDDTVIASARNTFGYRADDHGNTTATATVMSGATANGIIENVDTADVDYFRFTAFGTTTITVDINTYLANLDPVLELYDNQGTLIETAAPANPVDAVITRMLPNGTYFARVRSNGGQGESGQYTLRVDVVPPPTLNVPSTPGDDQISIQFTSPTDYLVTFGGFTDFYTTAMFPQISFDGQGGNDTVLIFTPTGADSVTLNQSSATVMGTNYGISLTNTEFKYVFGDAADSATFTDTAGNDQLYQLPGYTLMLDGTLSYYNQVINFGATTANATQGADLAIVLGTPSSDSYTATTSSSTMSSPGLTLVANAFDQVFTFGAGGSDTGTFSGSSSDELFYGLGGYGFQVVTSGSFLQYFVGFNQVTAFAGTGNDSAVFYDAGGNDTFIGYPSGSGMSGAGYSDTAVSFDNVYALATGGGVDTANLDGADDNDILTGYADVTSLFRPGVYLIQAFNFKQVNAVMSGAGTDLAELVDTVGGAVLNASGSSAEITYASGNKILVSAFDLVFAKNQSGIANTKTVAPQLAYLLTFEGNWG